jgi:hypothetical protein
MSFAGSLESDVKPKNAILQLSVPKTDYVTFVISSYKKN